MIDIGKLYTYVALWGSLFSISILISKPPFYLWADMFNMSDALQSTLQIYSLFSNCYIWLTNATLVRT